jgi:hypothetical protein
LGRLFESTGCDAKREIFKNKLGKKILKTSSEKLSHGVNNPIKWFYDDENPENLTHILNRKGITIRNPLDT